MTMSIANNVLPTGVGSVEVISRVTVSVRNLNTETSGNISSSFIVRPIKANFTRHVVVMKMHVFRNVAF